MYSGFGDELGGFLGFSDWIVLGRWIVSDFLWWRRSKVDGFRRGRLGGGGGLGSGGDG